MAIYKCDVCGKAICSHSDIYSRNLFTGKVLCWEHRLTLRDKIRRLFDKALSGHSESALFIVFIIAIILALGLGYERGKQAQWEIDMAQHAKEWPKDVELIVEMLNKQGIPMKITRGGNVVEEK